MNIIKGGCGSACSQVNGGSMASLHPIISPVYSLFSSFSHRRPRRLNDMTGNPAAFAPAAALDGGVRNHDFHIV